jgi:hypothetical protein
LHLLRELGRELRPVRQVLPAQEPFVSRPAAQVDARSEKRDDHPVSEHRLGDHLGVAENARVDRRSRC